MAAMWVFLMFFARSLKNAEYTSRSADFSKLTSVSTH